VGNKGSATNQSGYAGSNDYSGDTTARPGTPEYRAQVYHNIPPEHLPWEIRYMRKMDANEKKNDARKEMRKAQGLSSEAMIGFWFVVLPFLSIFGIWGLFDKYGAARIIDLSKHWILYQSLPMAIVAAITFFWLGTEFDELEGIHSHKYGVVPDYLIALRETFLRNVSFASPVTYAVILHTTAFNFWFLAFVISLLPTPITFYLLRIFLSRPSWVKAYSESAESKRAEAEKIRAEAEKIRAEAKKVLVENERRRITAIQTFQQKVRQAEQQKAEQRKAEQEKADQPKQELTKNRIDALEDALSRLSEVTDKVIPKSPESGSVLTDGGNEIPKSIEKALRDALEDVSNCLSACQGLLTQNEIGHYRSGLYKLRCELYERFGLPNL